MDEDEVTFWLDFIVTITTLNKWSKNFGDRLHSSGDFFVGKI